MSLVLTLNKPYVSTNLDSYIFTIPADGIYSIVFSATVPAAPAEGAGAGSGKDNGHGAGAGGGAAGFVGGGFGPGFGGVGQSIGPSDGYAHSLPDVKVPVTFPPVTSQLLVTVNKNAAPLYVSPAFVEAQIGMEFKVTFPFVAGDVVTIVPASLNPFDFIAKMTAAINQGL